MRVDLTPIVEQAEALLSAIESKSRGPARDAAHLLLCALPIPSWADPAHGMTVLYGVEREFHPQLEFLRYIACTWMRWLDSDEVDRKWPHPMSLDETISRLQEYIPQNASVS